MAKSMTKTYIFTEILASVIFVFLSMFFTFKISQKFSDYEALLGSHVAAGLHANQIGNRFQLSVNEIYKIIISILK